MTCLPSALRKRRGNDYDDTRFLQAGDEKATVCRASNHLFEHTTMCAKDRDWQTRCRLHDLANVDSALFDFYARGCECVVVLN